MMKIKEEKRMEMLAEEAFIRRAAMLHMPFMLKGSYVTRQYFDHPMDRIPADVDWVYMEPIEQIGTATAIFDDWVQSITDLQLKDGVEFRSFARNKFWRYVDYAMSDDFPTVGTDLLCWVHGEDVVINVDISFNLDFGNQSVPLAYQAVSGHDFVYPYTVPLSYQVAWKIHQTLIRPRFKDLFDLTHLVKHDAFNDQVLAEALQALVDECHADGVAPQKIQYFLAGDFGMLFPRDNPIETAWKYWRHGSDYINYCEAATQTDVNQLPVELSDFLIQTTEIFREAGLVLDLMEGLPSPSNLPSTTEPKTSWYASVMKVLGIRKD